MTLTVIPSINYMIQQISIYFGISVYFLGVIGCLLNLLVFLTSRIIREKTSVFYLIMISIFDLGKLVIHTSSYILSWGYEIDWTLKSLFYCKLKVFLLTIFLLSSRTFLLLSSIDQYFLTCSSSYWQKWPNTKRAHRFVGIFITIYIIHGIPYLIYIDHIISSSTNKTICQITNKTFIQYHAYGFFLIFTNLLPFLTAIFGLMTYYNVRHLTSGKIRVFRHELDKQLTKMILIQILVCFCTFLPYCIQSIYALICQNNEPIFRAKMKLKSILTLLFSNLSYASSFYIYIFVSKYFRRHLLFILFNINFSKSRSIPPMIDDNKSTQPLTISDGC